MNRTIERHLVVSVDDEPAILASLSRCLRSEPYQLLTTDSPERALHWVRTREISLIIADERMPGMSGSELMDQVSLRSPSTARILLTAYAGAAYSERGVRGRTEVLISKPWDNTMLRRTIRQLLHDQEWDRSQEEEAVRP